jgi:hypothetical protein
LRTTSEACAGRLGELAKEYGFHWLAIDGGTIILEDAISNRMEFGVSGSGDGQASAGLSTLVGIVLDAQFSDCGAGERDLALLRCESLKSFGVSRECVILHDRGCASAEIVKAADKSGAHWIFRLKRGCSGVVDALPEGTDEVVEIFLTARASSRGWRSSPCIAARLKRCSSILIFPKMPFHSKT